MIRALAILGVAGMLAACASQKVETGGPRPPEGVSRLGTNFGNWNLDAEGAVDQGFRSQILSSYPMTDAARARRDLEADGFRCQDGNRPDGAPVPELDCLRMFRMNDIVHAWTVQFWPKEARPRARYIRTQSRDPTKVYDTRGKRGG